MNNEQNFKNKMVAMYGNEGQQWLDSLHTTIEHLRDAWQLSNLKVMDNLSMNYVLSGNRAGEAIILKLGFEKDGIAREAAALRYFNGQGCVKLLAHDELHGALLMQRMIPGTNLKELFPRQDHEAASIASQVIKNLQSAQMPVTGTFPLLSDWLTALDKHLDIPQHQLTKAQKLRDYLLTTTRTMVLLHGDLHHSNIICNGPTWVAIDPKGVMGDPVYETNCFIRNPLPELIDYCSIDEILKSRLTIFHENLGFDKQRMLDWGYVQSVVSACWMIENNLSPEVSVKLAHIIEKIVV